MNLYMKAWRRLYQPVEKLLNLKCCAFDPSLRMRDAGFNQDIHVPTIEIPVWLARRIVVLGAARQLVNLLEADKG